MFPIRDENNSRQTFPIVTYLLIALNVVFFLIELNSSDKFILRWAFVPSRFLVDPAGDLLTLLTSMFMHAGWVHLLGNMLYLWIFGDNVEDRFGHLGFLVFYLLCGLAASFAQLATSQSSDIPNLGASGAIAGVLGAYLVMFPSARVLVLGGFRIIPVPALMVIGLWFILQLFNGLGTVVSATSDGDGIAFMAHIGGFIAGLVLTLLFHGKSRTRLTT